MKTIKILSAVIIILLISSGVNGQTTSKDNTKGPKTETFKVNGACGMCKTRIEDGLKIDGVSKAEWDQKTKMATVTYDPSKVTVDAMKKKVASLGHDTDKYKSPDDVYAKLPGCCHYDRTK
jgi:mercuric ion binding protein